MASKASSFYPLPSPFWTLQTWIGKPWNTEIEKFRDNVYFNPGPAIKPWSFVGHISHLCAGQMPSRGFKYFTKMEGKDFLAGIKRITLVVDTNIHWNTDVKQLVWGEYECISESVWSPGMHLFMHL